MVIFLLTVRVLGAFLTSDGAPVGSRMPPTGSFVNDNVDRLTDESTNTNQCQQSELQMILIEAIFSFTNNFYAIRNGFQPQPGVHKICIPVTYYIFCTLSDQSDQDSINIINCTTGYQQSIIWTEFDTTDTAGSTVFAFALSGFSVFGFDWAGACDTSDFNSVPVLLLLNTTSLFCNGTDQIDLQQTLLSITTLVSMIITIVFYEKNNLYYI